MASMEATANLLPPVRVVLQIRVLSRDTSCVPLMAGGGKRAPVSEARRRSACKRNAQTNDGVPRVFDRLCGHARGPDSRAAGCGVILCEGC